jgi:hypothetical protein
MSLTPNTPDLGQKIKSFWDKPEGQTGKALLGIATVAGAGLLLLFWGTIVPFILATVQNTVLLAAWILGSIAAFYVMTNWRTKIIFQLICRWITSFWRDLDPIGILKNMIIELRKRLETIQKHISVIAGVRQQLDDNIADNKNQIEESAKKVKYCDDQIPKQKAPLDQQRLMFTRQENVEKVADLTRDTKDLTVLRTQIDRLYSILQRMGLATQYYINQRENKVKMAEKKYKAVNSAFKAMTAAKSAFGGSSSEQAFYEETFQMLADDASMKVGAIDDFARLTEQFLSDVDVTRGAANFDVLNQLEQASMKLLPPGSSDPGFIETIPADTREPVPVLAKSSGSSGDYDRMFGGK